jgi:heme A synthase
MERLSGMTRSALLLIVSVALVAAAGFAEVTYGLPILIAPAASVATHTWVDDRPLVFTAKVGNTD